jgi:excisionase family DNA binding protein
MEHTWLTVDELATALKVNPKSIRRAYRKGEIPVDRFCRFVRFNLERVKEALEAKGHRSSLVVLQKKEGTAQRDRRRQPAARAAAPPPTG